MHQPCSIILAITTAFALLPCCGYNQNGVRPSGAPIPKARAVPFKFVILTNRSLAPGFTPLADFRNVHGIPTQIHTLEDDLGQYPDSAGNDLTRRIRRYLKDLHDNFGVEYVLLGGDTEIIPPSYYFTSQVLTDAIYDIVGGPVTVPTDVFYQNLSITTIPANGSIAIPSSGLPIEVYAGRAPVNNLSEVRNFVQKTIRYENDRLVNAAHMNKSLIIGEMITQIDDPNNTLDPASIDFASTHLQYDDGAGSVESLILNHEPNSRAMYEDYVRVNGQDVVRLLTPNTIANAIEEDYHFVLGFGHSNSYTTFKLALNLPVPFISQLTHDRIESGLCVLGFCFRWLDDTLQNRKNPTIWKDGCASAAYDNLEPFIMALRHLTPEQMIYDSIGEALMVQSAEYGAAAYFGASRLGIMPGGPSRTPMTKLARIFLRKIYIDGINEIGRAFAQAKQEFSQDGVLVNNYDLTAFFNQNLFGDPTLGFR